MKPKRYWNMARILSVALSWGAILLTASCWADSENNPGGNAALIIVLDGLRPDYVTPELMPNLVALGERGVVGTRHHAVYPTVTRVNAPSIVTGATPGRHGLLHNTVYLPEYYADPFSSGSVASLRQVEEESNGNLFTAPSLGEILAGAGRNMWVAGSCGAGTAFLLNHRLAGHGVLSARGFVLPANQEERVNARMGGFPEGADEIPHRSRNRWAIDAVLGIGLDELRPDLTLLWITDPDYTTHKMGVGHPLTLEAVRHVDEELGRLLDGIRERGLDDRINIFVTTDHGFSTLSHELDPAEAVAAAGVDPMRYRVVPDRGKVYVEKNDPDVIRTIVRSLQENLAVGAIFTRGNRSGDFYGQAPGTLSLASVDYDHERAPDILFDAAWSDRPNEYGYSGYTTQTRYPANHGTSSPFDLQITLIAAGPDIKSGVVIGVPTGNIDLAPTVCHLLDISPPPSMEGRVLHEWLVGGPAASDLNVQEKIFTAHTRLEESNVDYEVQVTRLSTGGASYLHFTQTSRTSR